MLGWAKKLEKKLKAHEKKNIIETSDSFVTLV